MKILQRAADAFLSLIYPPHCALCGSDTVAGKHLCDRCLEKAARIDAPFCRQCSQPFDGAIEGAFTCSNCEDRHYHFDCAVSCYRSTGIVRELVHRFKYDRCVYLRRPLGEWLAETLEDERILAHSFDYLVPVPLHAARMREREFNQADVLTQLIAERHGERVLHALRRVRYTTTQTRLDREERRQNLRDAFRVRHSRRVSGSHLILVDDVFTTGSTVDECARVLKESGAASVRVVTVARG